MLKRLKNGSFSQIFSFIAFVCILVATRANPYTFIAQTSSLEDAVSKPFVFIFFYVSAALTCVADVVFIVFRETHRQSRRFIAYDILSNAILLALFATSSILLLRYKLVHVQICEFGITDVDYRICASLSGALFTATFSCVALFLTVLVTTIGYIGM